LSKGIKSICSELKEQIFLPRKKHSLIINQEISFSQVRACLYIVEDTELAIQAFLRDKEGFEIGKAYLEIFGLMQALFVQQDATFYLVECLGTDWNHHNIQELAEIREIRNHCIGHPSKQGRGKGPFSFNAISRPTVRTCSFQIMRSYSDERPQEFVDYDLSQIAEIQNREIEKALNGILHLLIEEEMTHRKKYRKTKMAYLFSSACYFCEKVELGAHGSESFGDLNEVFDSLEKLVSDFKSELKRRDEYECRSDQFDDMFRFIDFPIRKLRDYFFTHTGSDDEKMTAEIFAHYLSEKIGELGDWAEEFDKKYENDLG
jgi:hypothetical protein